MCGFIHPLLQYAFIVWCLVRHRDNFTFNSLFMIPVPKIDNPYATRNIKETQIKQAVWQRPRAVFILLLVSGGTRFQISAPVPLALAVIFMVLHIP